MQERVQEKIDVNKLNKMGFWLTPRLRVVAETKLLHNRESSFKEVIVAFHSFGYGVDQINYQLFVRIVKFGEKFPRYNPAEGYDLTPYQVLQRLNGEVGFEAAQMQEKREQKQNQQKLIQTLPLH